jgi:hypothetical protein
MTADEQLRRLTDAQIAWGIDKAKSQIRFIEAMSQTDDYEARGVGHPNREMQGTVAGDHFVAAIDNRLSRLYRIALLDLERESVRRSQSDAPVKP